MDGADTKLLAKFAQSWIDGRSVQSSEGCKQRYLNEDHDLDTVIQSRGCPPNITYLGP